MLYDRSHSQTTQAYGQNDIQFEYGRPPKIAVQPDLNTMIGMGGQGRDLVQFTLEWHHGHAETIKHRIESLRDFELNLRIAHTVPGMANRQLKMRYAKIGDMLGANCLQLRYLWI